MHIFTTESVSGMTIEKNFGTVFGTVVRSRNVVGRTMGNISAFFGGRQSGDTKMVNETRDQAMSELGSNAEALGANAVLAMRFDSGEFDSGNGNIMQEITAYGTAVFLVRTPAETTPD